jgi:hypothetical protein
MKSHSFASTPRSKELLPLAQIAGSSFVIKRDGSFAKVISFSCDYKLEESSPEE